MLNQFLLTEPIQNTNPTPYRQYRKYVHAARPIISDNYQSGIKYKFNKFDLVIAMCAEVFCPVDGVCYKSYGCLIAKASLKRWLL